jgi:hypothetical protein
MMSVSPRLADDTGPSAGKETIPSGDARPRCLRGLSAPRPPCSPALQKSLPARFGMSMTGALGAQLLGVLHQWFVGMNFAVPAAVAGDVHACSRGVFLRLERTTARRAETDDDMGHLMGLRCAGRSALPTVGTADVKRKVPRGRCPGSPRRGQAIVVNRREWSRGSAGSPAHTNRRGRPHPPRCAPQDDQCTARPR